MRRRSDQEYLTARGWCQNQRGPKDPPETEMPWWNSIDGEATCKLALTIQLARDAVEERAMYRLAYSAALPDELSGKEGHRWASEMADQAEKDYRARFGREVLVEEGEEAASPQPETLVEGSATVKPASFQCSRCEGCGQIADNERGEPWRAWLELPPGSDIAVRLGMVKPIPCPVCKGAKVTS